jgi:hypothetical protein
MRIQELTEQQGRFGIVVGLTHDREFYDIAFVNYNNPVQELTGHFRNTGEHFIRTLKRTGAWEQVFPFLQKRFQFTPLGEDYSSEDAKFFLFGPLSDRDLNQLEDVFVEEVGL